MGDMMQKINIKAFSLAFGSTFGIGMLMLGIAAVYGWGTGLVQAISSLYIGFAPTLPGILLGGVWGFVDGAIGGLLIAWIYNSFAKKK